ncbi:MAG TPA: SDR family oxidoreductase [Chloroflexota bacterium]|nr:SDR family oxidoreductase [Chloroflexota bacterium]
MTLELQDRVALITGGGTGMGRAIANALAQRGAHVALGYAHSHTEADATANELRANGTRSSVHRADVARVADCDALVHSVLDTYGRLDVVVNAAGTTRHVPFPDLAAITEEAWDDIFDVNLKGAFFVSRAAGQWMREHGDGRGSIVNIASVAAFVARGSSLPYTVSKSAMIHLTRSLATALAPRVRVNAVAPGLVLTRWWTRLGQETVDRQVEGTIFKRAVALEDVVDAALLVIGNESMSGQTVTIDLVNVMH